MPWHFDVTASADEMPAEIPAAGGITPRVVDSTGLEVEPGDTGVKSLETIELSNPGASTAAQAAYEAALSLVKSGSLGGGSFNVQLTGHTNRGDPEDAEANYVRISIFQVPAEAEPPAEAPAESAPA